MGFAENKFGFLSLFFGIFPWVVFFLLSNLVQDMAGFYFLFLVPSLLCIVLVFLAWYKNEKNSFFWKAGLSLFVVNVIFFALMFLVGLTTIID